MSPGTTDTQLPLFVTQEDQQSPVRDISESGNAEESKGGGGVCRSARCAGVVLHLMHIHVAISGNDEQLSHGRSRGSVSVTVMPKIVCKYTVTTESHTHSIRV